MAALPEHHGLIRGADVHFEAGRVSSVGYLKPYKKLLADIVTSTATLSKALAFANELYLALEARECRVTLAPSDEHLHRAEIDHRENGKGAAGYNEIWKPGKVTVVYIGTLAIGLTIFEMSESVTMRYVGDGKYVRDSEYAPPKRRRYEIDRTWTIERNAASGRLCLQAYSPYHGAEWSKKWKETATSDLSTQIPSIVRALQQDAPQIADLVASARRAAEIEEEKWQRQMLEWDRQQAAERAAKALKDSKAELLAIIDAWALAKRIEEFFVNANAAIASVSLSDTERAQLATRITKGKELATTLDPIALLKAWKTPDDRLG